MEQQHSLQHYLDFLEVFNNTKKFKQVKDVAQFLGITPEAVTSKAKRYRMLRRGNPELGLPPIIDRSRVDEDGSYPLLDEQQSVRESCIDYKKLSGNKTYVITSAQYGSKVNPLFLRSLKLFCKMNNAELVVLPIKYGSMFEPMDPALDGKVCYKSTRLNNVIGLNITHLRPTLVNPLGGMEKFGFELGQIFASPKVALKMVPTPSTDKHKPIMTTGSVTYPYYQLSKTGSVAERDHKFGAVIVDIKDDNTYQFRHVISPDGESFSDAVTMSEYTPTGVESIESTAAVVCGDWHVGHTRESVRRATLLNKDSLIQTVNPDWVVLHDFFDGYSVSHHTDKNTTVRARMAEAGHNSLEKELIKNHVELGVFLHQLPKQTNIFMAASNHLDHLDRYLAEARYTKDPINTRLASSLHAGCIETGRPAFEYYIDTMSPLNDAAKARVVWGGRNEEFNLHGVELGMHGDVGANGARGNAKAYDKFCHGSITGHTHTPNIEGNHYTVGTSTELTLPYTKGLSSWLNTHAVLFNTGQVQLINIIKGDWK